MNRIIWLMMENHEVVNAKGILFGEAF